MNRHHPITIVAALAIIFSGHSPISFAQPGDTSRSVAPAARPLTIGLRGVYFVENAGQWGDAGVQYGFKTRGLDIAFRESSFTMHLARQVLARQDLAPDSIRGCEDFVTAGEHLTLAVSFPGSNDVQPTGAQPQSAKFNYFVGDDDSRWASNVPSFAAIIYENLYDGVDLYITGSNGGVLKYEFHVAPGADYGRIRIRYDGIESLCIDDTGDLQINTTFGTLTDVAPKVWQSDGGTAVPAVESGSGAIVPADQREGTKDTRSDGRDARSADALIPARFNLIDDATYTIALDSPVDPTRTLIIDPDVEWMVYLGGTGNDNGNATAVTSDGDILIAGYTSSIDFLERLNQHHGGLVDCFLTRVSPNGRVRWMTYIGGTDWENGYGVCSDSDGNAFVAGRTRSEDLAGSLNAFHGDNDAFVCKVDQDGHLSWSLFLGGSGWDQGRSIAYNSGNLVVAGETRSRDLEGRSNEFEGGYNDGFVAALATDGELNWSTYIGGSGSETCNGIDVDAAHRIYTAGGTSSSDLPTGLNELRDTADGFVAAVEPTGAVLWSRYLGGSEGEDGKAVACTENGDVWTTGSTWSPDMTGSINGPFGGSDVYVARLNRDGELLLSAYLGGSGDEDGTSIAATRRESVFVAGGTDSRDFVARTNSFIGGFVDAFVMEVSDQGEPRWSLYMGGSSAEGVSGLAVSAYDDLIAVGTTESPNFVRSLNSHHYGGSYLDAYVARVRLADRLSIVLRTSCPNGGPATLAWRNATPHERAALGFATHRGAFVVPDGAACAGTQLRLGSQNLRVVGAMHAGPDGFGTLRMSINPRACGGYLQLVDLTTCATSNVVRIE